MTEAGPREEICSRHAALLYFCDAIRRLGAGLHLFGDASALATYVPGRERFIRMAATRARDRARLVEAEVGSVLRAVAGRDLEDVARSPGEFLLSAGPPPMDLVIRTGGHRRLSGFLPLQTACAEFSFADTLWPSFARDEFADAHEWYARQERHFGE